MTKEDQIKREDERLRGERARQILEDPLVKSAMSDIKATLIEQWRISPVKDAELREYLWSIYLGACKFEELLASHIETGKLASHQLARDAHRPV